jgi:hypothetical protein
MSSVDSPERDLRRTYALVILCHAAVITALWLFGRAFSG